MNEWIIIGAGGHARVAADAILKSGDTVLGFLDDRVPIGTEFFGIPVLSRIDEYLCRPDKCCRYLIGIGNNAVRKSIAQRYDLNYAVVSHPNSTVGIGVTVGTGTLLMPGSVINTGVRIGNHCIINTCACVDHDCVIGDYTHIGPNAALAGGVRVGALSFVGAGAVVKNGVSIGQNVVVGAGAAVVGDALPDSVYLGVPAKRR